MPHMQTRRVVIRTPEGTILVARPLYRHLERKLAPDEWGLLRNYDWWTHLSESTALINIFPKGMSLDETSTF
jgi:hypothetical protein